MNCFLKIYNPVYGEKGETPEAVYYVSEVSDSGDEVN